MQGISVIVCCYNSATRIVSTLNHLLNQKIDDFDFEIVVINNASTDNTTEIVEDYRLNNQNINIKLFQENNPGLFYARKKGYYKSKYEYIIYCDDDNWLEENYLSNVYRILTENSKISILGGIAEPVFEGGKPIWFDKYQHNFAVGDQSTSIDQLSKVELLYGAGFAIRKSYLNILYTKEIHFLLSGRSGKKLMSGDDNEWCILAKQMGCEIWYNRNLKFKHYMPENRMNWQYLKKLHEGFGRSKVYIEAYNYMVINGKEPLDNLRFPFWFNKLVYKIGEISKIYPKVIGRFNELGNDDVLKYYALKGEISEVWSLKKRYIGIYKIVKLNFEKLY
jgi:glycosyltransferase involved in cell wall biosynthesis